MRRFNSEFQTKNLSHEGQKLKNRDYFGYVEMEDFTCYCMADSLDDDPTQNSAQYVVESIIRSFTEKPTLKKHLLNKYILKAHEELKSKRGGMRLKSSVVLVVTDYQKMRFCYVGNSRFYLIRNGRFLEQTKDQSLTFNMMEQQEIATDQAQLHEERNNLYSYLGENTASSAISKPDIIISAKIKLEDGDIIAQLTRGAWEILSDEDLSKIVEGATEPQEIINGAEDNILGQQEERFIDNFSLAITLVSKVYVSPEKKFSIKKIMMIAIPIIIIILIISIVLYINHRNIKDKEFKLANYMASGEEYLRYDNYKKAAEEYTEAKAIATDLKRENEIAEANEYLKLAEQILLADEALLAEEYIKAQELYLSAREMSIRAGNIGISYLDRQLSQTKTYIEILDWISIGEVREGFEDLPGAIEAYRQARQRAAALYARALRDEALQKQTAAEEKLNLIMQEQAAKEDAIRQDAIAEAAKEAEILAGAMELENQQKTNDQKNAIELENQANELMAKGEFDHAITFYRTAQSIYRRLELFEQADSIDEKIKAAEAGSAVAANIEKAEEKAAAEAAAAEAAKDSVSGNELKRER